MKKSVIIYAIAITAVLFCIDIYSQTKELTVISHKPSGFLYENVNEITIIFSADMVPLNKGDELTPPVKIKPEIDGRWVWKSPRQLTFFPDDKLDQNRKYTVTVQKGLKSLDKKSELNKNFSFVFVNNANRVVSVYGYSKGKISYGDRIKIDDTLSVTFVYPPLSAEVDNKITLYDAKAKKFIPIKIKFRKDPKTIDIIFKKNLSYNADYTLKIDYTLRSDAGDMGLASNYMLDFKTPKEILLLDHTKNDVNPENPVKLKFTDYIESDELKESILVIRGSDTLENNQIEIWQDYDYEENSASYNLYFYKDGESEYKIVLPKGYGKTKNKEYSFKVKSLPFDPYIDLNGKSFLLESYKSGMIPVKSMNYDSASVEIFRIEERETVKVVSKTIPVSTKKNRYQTIPIKFKELVGGRSGFYRMKVTAKKKILFDCDVNFTRYALMAKLAYDKMIVLAYDLETGEPVKGGEVSVLSKNLKGKTDKNGVCEFSCSLTKKERDGYSDLMIFFSKEGEFSVLKVNDDTYGPDGSRNLYTSYGYYKVYNDDWSMKYYLESRTRMFVYTDRGLYKPGEVLYVKGMKRVIDKNEWGYSNEKKVLVTISDSRNNEIKKLETFLNEYGTFAFACTLSASSPTGSYQIVSRSGDKEEYSYFRVEEFKPLEFDVTVVSNAKHVFRGDSPSASVSGRYMFGSQMSGDSIRWRITSQRYSFTPEGFEGYSFYSSRAGYYYDYGGYDGEYYDYEYSYGKRHVVYEAEDVLDSNGMYMISERIDLMNEDSPLLLTYSATVKSASGQEITRSTNMVYHPDKTYVGIRSTKYVFDSANPPVFSIVSVDESGKYVKGIECSLIVVTEKYISVKKTGTYGRTFWESNYMLDTIFTDKVKITNGNVTYKIKEEIETGYYYVYAKYSVKGKEHIVSENFYYAGKDEGWWQVRDDNYIEVIPDKKSGEYQIGEKAKVFVKAPFKNLSGYVTIEREGIYENFPIKMKSNAMTINVPMTEEMLPNAYFSVFLYKGRSSNEILDDSIDLGKPYFGVGFCNLKVSSEKRKQKIEINLDKESFKPQERVTASVQVINSGGKGVQSEISVAVVDLGILNLIGFETPDPFREFYKSRNHDVSLSTNAGDIVGERNYGEKGENRGGDGGMNKFRTEFLPIIYYKAQIETDKEGRATVEFDLPDNLTSFRIMVVSCGKRDFGSGEKDFTVSKDFMINPSILNFVRNGDEFTGGVVAVNMTK
ncbi:MAG: MG2 domain-containing protein, partial [bacterium]|nr:MG2 domain-containing protein [bacterium]